MEMENEMEQKEIDEHLKVLEDCNTKINKRLDEAVKRGEITQEELNETTVDRK